MTAAPTRSGDEWILRRAARRIGLQTACAVALVSVGLAAAAVLVVLGAQHRDDTELIRMAIARADDVTDPPAGMWLVIRQHGTEITTPGLPPGLPDQQQIDEVTTDRLTRSTDLRTHDRKYRVQTEAEPGGRVVQALLDLSQDDAERFGLVEVSTITGVIGLLLAAAAGVWLAPRAVAPLADALTLQRRFVADASHELRTPLTLLSTRAQLIRRELHSNADVAVVSSDIDELMADAANLTEILDDLLVAAGPRKVDTDETVRLPELVIQAVEAMRPTASEYGIELSCHVTGAPPPVSGNPASLRRAVTALLDNAFRHATTGVGVVIALDGRDVVVDVVDDGPGIAAEIVSTMFDRFATTGSTSDRHGPRRYGLGLALVNEVAAQHGGTVSVLDDGQRGAKLRLRFPAIRPVPDGRHPCHTRSV